jgi:glycosyltransferase involved in cell wall biosynthesis
VRFPADPRRPAIFSAINDRLLHHRPLTLHEEEAFFRESINSTPLLRWVARERPDDLIVTLPYCYGLTFFATLAFAERTVLVPCLHREAYARMLHTAEMLERAAGLAFLTEEEEGIARAVADLAGRPRAVLGMWVDGADHPARQAGERERRAAQARFAGAADIPYLAVVGWQDPAKGLPFLYECFADLLHAHRQRVGEPMPRLVLAGPGHVPLPPSLAGESVRQAGMLDEEAKRALVRGAEWLVQPSLNESFSLVLMEAWREGTPALVNALCAVTRGHCVRSGGGLYFANGEELAEAIAWGRRHRRDHAAMGRHGAAYVAEHFATGPLDAAWEGFRRAPHAGGVGSDRRGAR